MSITGKKVLITGGLKGFGAAITDTVAQQEGMTIGLLARQKEATTDEQLALARSKYNCDMRFFESDIRDAKSVQEAVERAAKSMGGIDILIIASTIAIIKPGAQTEVDILDLSYQINTRATHLLCHSARPWLVESGHGQILNISPPINLDPRQLASKLPYASTQYMRSMLTTALANDDEWKQQNIRINSLWPLHPFADGENMYLYQPHTEKENLKKPVNSFAKAALAILNEEGWNGEFFYDDEVLEDTEANDRSQMVIENYNNKYARDLEYNN